MIILLWSTRIQRILSRFDLAESSKEWRELHTLQWMRENGLESFTAAFKEAGIDGIWLLAGITEQVQLYSAFISDMSDGFHFNQFHVPS